MFKGKFDVISAAVAISASLLVLFFVTYRYEEKLLQDERERRSLIAEHDRAVSICQNALRALYSGRNAFRTNLDPVDIPVTQIFIPEDEYIYSHFLYYGVWMPPMQESALLKALDGEVVVLVLGDRMEVRWSSDLRDAAKDEPLLPYATCESSLDGGIDAVQLMLGAKQQPHDEVRFRVENPEVFAPAEEPSAR